MEAAAGVFATHGEQVDVREIARCAGVGMGTLYRHFSTKDELLQSVLRQDFAEWTRTAREDAAAQDDPGVALARFLRDALQRQAHHRALGEHLAEAWDTAPGMVACRDACQEELHPVIDDLVSRCHGAGVLRPGVTSEDISLLLVALGSIAQLAAQQRPEMWRRALQITLDGLGPSHQTALLPTSQPIDA